MLEYTDILNVRMGEKKEKLEASKKNETQNGGSQNERKREGTEIANASLSIAEKPIDPQSPAAKLQTRLAALTDAIKAADTAKLKESSIEDIRYNAFLLKNAPEEDPDKITNLKEETARRLKAYTDEEKNGQYRLNYHQVGGDKHNRMIGLGDILVDPDIQVIEVEKKDGRKFFAERGKNSDERVCFLNEGKYVATFTGDKFRIIQHQKNKETPSSQGKKETPEVKTYLIKLQNENAQRQEFKINYQASVNYSQDSIYENLRALGLRDAENLSNKDIIDHFQSMTGANLLQARNIVGAQKLHDLFLQTGLDKFSQKTELTAQIDKQVRALPQDNTILKAFKTPENLILRISQVAAQESSFRAFNWDKENYMGFFQFSPENTKTIGKNPLNPKEAVEGLLLLWTQNYKTRMKTEEQLVTAHNTGPGGISSQEGHNYFQNVTNRNLPEFTDTENKSDFLATQLRVTNPLSAEFEQDPNTGSTLCSRTAYKNLLTMGVKNPLLKNAIDVENSYQENQKVKGENNSTIAINLRKLNNQKTVIAADVFVTSSSTFGHRAAAYKGADGHWRILDPYRNNRSITGVKFEDYTGNIKFVVPMTKDGPYLGNPTAAFYS